MKQSVIFRWFRSFSGKLFSAFFLCIAVLLLINWGFNRFAFLRYYEKEKSNQLTAAYTAVNTYRGSVAALNTVLDQLHTNTGMHLIVWSEQELIYSSFLPGRQSQDGLPLNSLMLSALSQPYGTYTLLHQSPDFSNETDARDFLTLYGKTDTGINLILWISLTDVTESTAILNRFLLWSGVVTLLIGGILLWFFARSTAAPIRRLSAKARRMAGLDFDDRYVPDRQDELAELGQSLNTVSDKLQTSLSELKTANAHLLQDMESQTREAEARTQFIRNVSHELKTPIALIQTYAEGLQENTADDEESRRYYSTVIEDEAMRLSEIIAKMTMLMQLEAGKEELSIEQFDLHRLAEKLITRYAPFFEERQVAHPALPDAPCRVWGDAGLIENVLTNYLTNALNHVSQHGKIRIGWELTDHSTERITVFNTGDPIPEEDLRHIWESFYKVDKARTRAYGGTGIGLSVVAAILKAHRMPYGVENTADGVCFWLELPTE